MVKIYVLDDNRCSDSNFECEHGISLFIECYGKRILFDSAQTDIYIKNAQKLNVDLSHIDAIVLSHGDYDHGNGFKYLDTKTDFICHPDYVIPRVSKRTGNYNGLNQTREQLQERFNLIETKEPYYIDDNIIFLGQIERNNDFETEKNLPAWDTEGNTYQFYDDSGLVINTENGLIVFSGCAHSGICNTIEYAKKLTGNYNVLAVIGGFHLKEVDDQTNKTMEYMKENNVTNILLAHCTSDKVCEEFKNKLPEITTIIETGKIFEL